MARKRSLRDRVAERARHCCEYCRLPDDLTSVPFQLDHVIAEKHSGATSFDNLAWVCLHCNSFKGPNLAGHDTNTGDVVPLFNPRADDWNEHFSWHGPVLVGKTSKGRATIDVLRINLAYRVASRSSLVEEHLFPPADDASTP